MTSSDVVVVIDTSVLVTHALSGQRGGAASKLIALAAAGGGFSLVLSDGIRLELVSVLRRAGWTEAEVEHFYQPVFERARFLEPVPESAHHIGAVNGDAKDAVIVRTAEAIYGGCCPELVAASHKFIVTGNTKHFRPGASWAGFLYVTPARFLRAETNASVATECDDESM